MTAVRNVDNCMFIAAAAAAAEGDTHGVDITGYTAMLIHLYSVWTDHITV